MKEIQGKKKKKIPKWQIISLVITIIVTVAVLGFLFGFRITEVTVEGNIHYTENEIKDLVMDGFFADNSLALSISKSDVQFDNKPFLNFIQVRMTGRNSIRIRVNEKSVVGYVECENAYWYFNRDGIVVERCDTPAMTAEERIAKEESINSGDTAAAVEAEITVKNYVPEVRGFSFETVVLGEQLPVEDESIFNSLYSINQMMNKDNIPADFVLFDKEYNIYLYYGSAEVRLGQDDRLEEKMTTLAAIMPQMEGMSGILHLENYAGSGAQVVFEKSTS